MPKIKNAKILILATDGFEQSELEVPRAKLKAVAQLVHVAAPKKRKDKKAIKGWKDGDWGNDVPVDVELADASTSLYDALVLPGGQMNPDSLRQIPEAMDLIKAFIADGKVVAAICHAPWLLIEANAIRGRKATSYSSIKTDMINAGANWVDEPVVADQGIVTSRNPGDLDAFVAKIIEEIEEGKHLRLSDRIPRTQKKAGPLLADRRFHFFGGAAPLAGGCSWFIIVVGFTVIPFGMRMSPGFIPSGQASLSHFAFCVIAVFIGPPAFLPSPPIAGTPSTVPVTLTVYAAWKSPLSTERDVDLIGPIVHSDVVTKSAPSRVMTFLLHICFVIDEPACIICLSLASSMQK